MFSLAGVEDGQTVRMPVGKREIFITFRVGALLAQPLLGLTVMEKVQPRLLMEKWELHGICPAIRVSTESSGHLGGVVKCVSINLLCQVWKE